MNRLLRCLCCGCLLGGLPLQAETIFWFSDPGQTNLDGSGSPMDAGFQFELGVFANGFVPTSGNMDQWQTHWFAADSESYDPTNHRFAGTYTVTDNAAPFTVGASAWIMGRRETPTGSERILFRNSAWLWPAPNELSFSEWNVNEANLVVLGTVNGNGAPFLMQSSAFQTYAQWQTEHLAGESLAEPGDDADRDGTPNLLEFVFGTPPLIAGSPTPTPVELIGGHLQITIPRRQDRLATLVVEVSGDLTNWSSGSLHAEVVSDDATGLIVRDLTIFDVAHPKRFLRLRVVLP